MSKPGKREVVYEGVNVVIVGPTEEITGLLNRVILETTTTKAFFSGKLNNGTGSLVHHYNPSIIALSVVYPSQASASSSPIGENQVMLVLLVDDVVASSHFAKEVFENAGHEARIIKYGESALNIRCFLKIPALKGIALGFCTKHPHCVE